MRPVKILCLLYPGQFHNILLNLFNIVLVLGLSRPAMLHIRVPSPILSGGGWVRPRRACLPSCIYVCNRWMSADEVFWHRHEDDEVVLPLGAELWEEADNGFT
jgi:hypothetical protein